MVCGEKQVLRACLSAQVLLPFHLRVLFQSLRHCCVALDNRLQLFADWRGYLIAGFSLVWLANVYMSGFARLRGEIKGENEEIAVLQAAERSLAWTGKQS